ncbi:MAG: hypothetical protein IJ769_05080 [Clostridia bacterium]|nr:hypothetical protein [Clostridia bacterium]
MRKLTAILIVVLVLLAGLTAWFWLGGTLHAHIYIQTARASDYPDAYGAIRALLDSGAAPQRFNDAALSEDGSAYTLVDVNIALTNRGLFPAEWLDIRADAAPGDIAVHALTGEGGDVAARDSATVNLKLITTAPADAERDIHIQYYVHGMKRTVTVR